MPETTGSQAIIFVYSIAGGALAAFLYDLFRIKRRIIKTGMLATSIEDFVYWMLVSIIMLATVYYGNEGEIRGYIILGAAMGAILYFVALSHMVIDSSVFIANIIKQIILFIYKVVSFPINVLIKAIRIPLNAIGSVCVKTSSGIRRMSRNRCAKIKIGFKLFRNFTKKI